MIGLGSKSEVITITMVTITITKKLMVIVTGAKIGLQSSARMAGEKLYCPLGLTSNHCNLKMCWCWRWLCCPLFFLNQCHIQMLVIMIMMITMSTIYDILRWSRYNWKWICRNIQFLKSSRILWGYDLKCAQCLCVSSVRRLGRSQLFWLDADKKWRRMTEQIFAQDTKGRRRGR